MKINSYSNRFVASFAVFTAILAFSCLMVEGVFRGYNNKEDEENNGKDRQLDVEIQVQERNDGTVEIDIMNNIEAADSDFDKNFGGVTNPGNGGDDEREDDDDDDDCAIEDDTKLYVLLNIKADSKFRDYGRYKLQDDDDDDDDSSSGLTKYWDESKLPKGVVSTDSICLDRDGCYEFILYGKDKAFDNDDDDDDDTQAVDEDGYQMLWVDVGVGLKKQMEVTHTFDRERASFGCGCKDKTTGCK